jgi:uncharacterized protein
VREVFVDTWFWLARADRNDQHHPTVMAALPGLKRFRKVTTDEVLVEFLTSLSGYGRVFRLAGVQAVRRLHEDKDVEVIPQSRETFQAGLKLYEARPDKEYSLTDCISMATMRQRGLTEVLTQDHHFSQEGFILLPRK